MSLVRQLKDAQVRLAACPEKKIMMSILVVDIPASYRMLLSRSFCKDLGGEIQMDWSSANIPLKNGTFKLEPEPKSQFVVMKSQDPQAQVLYQEMGLGTYAML